MVLKILFSKEGLLGDIMEHEQYSEHSSNKDKMDDSPGKVKLGGEGLPRRCSGHAERRAERSRVTLKPI